MTSDENLLARLNHLREARSMRRSQCSGALLRTIRPLLEAGVVIEERSGAGRRLVVRNMEAFIEFCCQRFPDGAVPPGTSSRVTGVARFRDSKSLRNDVPEIICVRGLKPGALRWHGKTADVAGATGRHGVFAFALGSDTACSLHGVCALIENPAVFFAFEQLDLPVDIAIHARGRCSGRLLDWLAGQKDEGFMVWHLPDYDPVGLNEFGRVRSRLGRRARLYVPEDLPELFQRFSKRELMANVAAQRLLRELRASDLPEVRAIVALIHRHNAGLEQEALLLSAR